MFKEIPNCKTAKNINVNKLLVQLKNEEIEFSQIKNLHEQKLLSHEDFNRVHLSQFKPKFGQLDGALVMEYAIALADAITAMEEEQDKKKCLSILVSMLNQQISKAN